MATKPGLTRRDFLRASALSLAGLSLLSACAPAAPAAKPAETKPVEAKPAAPAAAAPPTAAPAAAAKPAEAPKPAEAAKPAAPAAASKPGEPKIGTSLIGKLEGPTVITDPAQGGVPEAVGSRIQLSFPGLPPEQYPAAGRQFFSAYEKRYGDDSPSPFAIYGYEEMALALDGIKRAGAKGNDRSAVLEALMATRDRESALGTYSVEPTGDTTMREYGIYRIRSGALTFDRTVDAV